LQLKKEKQNLKKQLTQASHPIFNLNFKIPEPNFDKKKVFGKVFSLIKVKEDRFIKPLEAIAGPKLRQIVVDN